MEFGGKWDHGIREGDKHPAYTPVGVCGTLYLLYGLSIAHDPDDVT